MSTKESDVHIDMVSSEDGNWEELPSFQEIQSKIQSVQSKNRKASFRIKIRAIIDSIWSQTFIFLLVVFDLILGLTNIVSNEQIRNDITLVIIVIYIIEISLRIYAYGIKTYFTSILDIIDFIAVLGSLILYIFAIVVVYPLLVKILRFIRVARATYRAIFSRTKKIQKAIREFQRSNLKGYHDKKYDLDIAYITDHILIMSRPTTKALDQFNHDALSEVKRFLDEKHGNAYRIFDLCVYDDIGIDSDSENKEKEKDLDKRDREASTSTTVLSIFPINIDVTDGPNIEYDNTQIINDFAFRGTTVLSMDRLFEFVDEATKYSDLSSNVVIIQSTSGLGRCMFMTACLLFYYYPKARIADIIKFVHSERVTDNDGDATALFARFLPSQARYIRYFAILISHCYGFVNDIEMDEDVQLERNLSIHVSHIHHQSLHIDDDVLNSLMDNSSKWNFYHQYARNMLDTKIAVVLKHIAVYNYFDEIDPYVHWEADIFQWKQEKSIEYETAPYGIDSKPGRNTALIQRFEHLKTMVLEKDFGIRIYKSVGNSQKERKNKRRIMAQLILHSHFINLDKDNCIRFNKDQIDFVNKDTNHKHFPHDFHIVLRAKILRKKK